MARSDLIRVGTARLRIRAWVTIILVSLPLVGCLSVERIPSEFPYDAMMSLADLGSEWSVEAQTFPDVDDAISSHSRTFRYGEDGTVSDAFIVHQLTLYASPAEAQGAFGYWRDQYIDGRTVDQRIPITPEGQADLSASRCEQMQVDGREIHSCYWIQQHGSAISFLHGFVDQDALRLEKFIELIRLVETRLSRLTTPDPSA